MEESSFRVLFGVGGVGLGRLGYIGVFTSFESRVGNRTV